MFYYLMAMLSFEVNLCLGEFSAPGPIVDSGYFGAAAPIWCLACQESLVVVGCGNGSIEVNKLTL